MIKAPASESVDVPAIGDRPGGDLTQEPDPQPVEPLYSQAPVGEAPSDCGPDVRLDDPQAPTESRAADVHESKQMAPPADSELDGNSETGGQDQLGQHAEKSTVLSGDVSAAKVETKAESMEVAGSQSFSMEIEEEINVSAEPVHEEVMAEPVKEDEVMAEPVKEEEVMAEPVKEEEGGGKRTLKEKKSEEEEENEEVPVVMRVDQFALKPKKEKRASKSKAAGRGRGRGRGGGRGRAKKDEADSEPEVIYDSEDEAQKAEPIKKLKPARKTRSEPKIERKRKAEPKAKPSAKSRARKSSVAATSARDAAGDEHKEDQGESEIVWGPLSVEGVQAVTKAYGWDMLEPSVQEAMKPVDASAPSEKHPDGGDSTGVKIKSFARRPYPRSGVPQARWLAIRDTFDEFIRPLLVNAGHPASGFEARITHRLPS